MIRKITLLFTLAIAASCSIQYDAETRLIADGILTDREGNPLSGRSVFVTIDNGSDSDVISNTTSGADGHFLMIFPAPETNGDKIMVGIFGDNRFQNKSFINLQRDDFKNYHFNFSSTLYKFDDVAQLNILLNQTDPSRHVTDIKIEGLQPFPEIYFHEPASDIIYMDSAMMFQVIKNQEVILHYSVLTDDNQNIEERSELITVGNAANTNYTITY